MLPSENNYMSHLRQEDAITVELAIKQCYQLVNWKLLE